MFNLISTQTANAAKCRVKNQSIIIARTFSDAFAPVSLKNDNEKRVVWQRPRRPATYGPVRSGDIGRYVEPDQSNICVKYQYATELEDAEPNVRNQFTLGWHTSDYSREFYEKTLMDSVRSHRYDYKSPVAMIAQLTGSIRFMQHQISEGIVHGYQRYVFKFEAIDLIKARNKLIKNLREVDYKQYEWLLERLDLQYKPKPQNEDEIMIARKEGLRQLTKAYCDNVKNQKLQEYRTELDAQKLPFLEQKLKNLEFIRNEQQTLGVDVTISQQQIDETRQRYEEMKKEHDSKKTAPTKKKWKMY